MPLRHPALLLGLLGLTLLPARGVTQERAPRSDGIVASAAERYNAPGTTRVSGTFRLAASDTLRGDLAILNGPVQIDGRVIGSLVAINADVSLEGTARIEGDLVILGGTLQRAPNAEVRGAILLQSEIVRYTLDGIRLVPEETGWIDWQPGRWLERAPAAPSYTDLVHVAARTYNRVEGLPVAIGPRFRRTTPWGRVDLGIAGIVRTAGPIRWDEGTLGHDSHLTLRLGDPAGVTLGLQTFDLVAPVESWQVGEREASLMAAIAGRDLRDHYGRHGATGWLGGRIGEALSLDLGYGRERWRDVASRDPLRLGGDRPWRPNPTMDAGRLGLTTVRLRIDTRDRARAPWSGGWFVLGEIEQGDGMLHRPGSADAAARATTYRRAFLDARRRAQLSRGTELSMRVVTAGWIGGDPLPLQRRLSLGGPGALEGYAFRTMRSEDPDVLTCGGRATDPGQPAWCDRVALLQLEVRRSSRMTWPLTGDRWRLRVVERPVWVLFADAGRGWIHRTDDRLTAPTAAATVFRSNGLPPLASFRTSVGGGLDLGSLGIYLAKAPTPRAEPLRLLVRIGRRF